jgi:aminopeptidase
MGIFKDDNDKTPSKTIVEEVCKIKKGERVLIIANPSTNQIAQDLFSACLEAEASPSLIFQLPKTLFDNSNPEVLASIATNPDVCFSISEIKLGKDPVASAKPYISEDGQEFSHIFDYLLDGKKTMRAVWTPGITEDMMNRTANIDYKELMENCKKMDETFKDADYVHVTSEGGTDVLVPIKGRKLLFDNGDFSKPGTGGNIPAGEVFISPLVPNENVKGIEGVIVYDGSMTFSDGASILETPIVCKLVEGHVTDIDGGNEAKRLLKTITEAENRAVSMEKEQKLPEGMGAIYKKNARNIGELGIGLNPAARITGNMLEDEKAYHTCHFAIGQNYDNDAPCLIHLDGVVKNPTIEIIYSNGEKKIILEKGFIKL